MAAEALVSAVIEQLVSFIQQEAEKEIRLLVGVEDEVQNLKDTFDAINAVMVDADRKQIKEESVKFWLENLKDVAYDMEDLLENWSFQLIANKQAHVDRPLPIKKKVLSYLSSPCICFRLLVLRHDVGREIKHIQKRLDSIVKLKNDYKLVASNGKVVVEEKLVHRELTSSVIDVSETYGRDFDKNVIKSELLPSEGNSSSSGSQVETLKLRIIAVVGMGGLGKTTLAQLLCNCDEVRNHFEKTKLWWVCVSDPFDKVRLAKAIIVEAGGQVPGGDLEWNALHNRLSDAVKDKRFLLVLDDVWTEDYIQWEPFKISLERAAQGSRVLVTTRSEKTAVMMKSVYIHRMGQLPEPDCWSLFSRIAFAGSSAEEDRSEFEEMGREIVKKCQGVPLSIKTIAGLMRHKRSRQEWQNVSSSDVWQELQLESKVLPALLLSYWALPSNLKRCFAYCAVFPKDYRFDKFKLIKLWMAYGFLNSNGRTDLEAIGEEYFDDLVMRSFFQDIEIDDGGNIIGCKMHDLVHDLAQLLSKNECLVVQHQITLVDSTERIRHLSIGNMENENVDFSFIYNAKKLHTLIIDDTAIEFHHFTCLRVLDISYSDLKHVPSKVGDLKHLRYLDLSHTNVETLPETLSNLLNLQSLDLTWCESLCKLPEGMGEMTNLRHLCIEETDELRYMPQGIEKLCNLCTLDKFIVGNMSEGCKLGALKNLNLLHGKLKIEGLGRVTNASEAKEAHLNEKKHFRYVGLYFGYGELEDMSEANFKTMEDVLEGLEIHTNVEDLYIRDYLGCNFPSWMMRAYSKNMPFKLRKLTLKNCNKCKHLPALGLLPYLESLIIDGMKELKRIERGFFGIAGGNVRISFPKLKKLEISEMKSLVEWQWVADEVDAMPQLCKLYLAFCPMLEALPPLGKLKSLKELEIQDVGLVKCIGLEFLGVSNDLQNNGVENRSLTAKVAFPQLYRLVLSDMRELEEWEFPIGQDRYNIMPCLRELKLFYCGKLRAFPALGVLKSLEVLEIIEIYSIKKIGPEIFGISNGSGNHGVDNRDPTTVTAFPKLNSLSLRGMYVWEEWEFPVGQDPYNIMPCLQELFIHSCNKLRAFPALGKLKSLEILDIYYLSSMKCIGLEFLGIRDDDEVIRIGDREPPVIRAFPALVSLKLGDMAELEEWELPAGKENMEIMPRLRSLEIFVCRKLKKFPPFGKLNSLESLTIRCLNSIKHVGLEFWGISEAQEFSRNDIDGDHREPLSIIAFPKLKELSFWGMMEWEKWEALPVVPTMKNEEHIGTDGARSSGSEELRIILPCLIKVSIKNCPKLKKMPCNISSRTSWSLYIDECPELTHAHMPAQGMGGLEHLGVRRWPPA